MGVRRQGLEEVAERPKLSEADDELTLGDEGAGCTGGGHGGRTPSGLNTKGPARTLGLSFNSTVLMISGCVKLDCTPGGFFIWFVLMIEDWFSTDERG